MTRRIFISADHGLAIVYFLQSDVVPSLIEAGLEVVLLTDETLIDKINQRFGQPGLIVESLRFKEAQHYLDTVKPAQQWWIDFLRRGGASNKINLQAVDNHISQVRTEARGRRKQLFPLMELMVALLRNSKAARKALARSQRAFSPPLYTDLFEKYQPDMVVASTPGWRLDRFLLRQAAARGVPTATVIVGWDNPSSYSLVGADMDWVTCWSELQKTELMDGADWEEGQIFIGGIPSYDGYVTKKWQMSREEYFKLHKLDPQRKLIAYASSFISFSPDYQNIEALVQLVEGDKLGEPCQLLVRLHPNHFMDVERFREEKERVFALAAKNPHVQVVEPVALGGELGHYSGEDMPEKTSMMAHADVFVTVYSTMAVEASMHDTPVIGLCIDSPEGWPGRYTLPLSQIGGWPTHQRFRESGAGRVALDENELQQHLMYYLENPQADLAARRKFVADECTYTDASAGVHTADNLLQMLEKGKYRK
jgi:hypothetical protein